MGRTTVDRKRAPKRLLYPTAALTWQEKPPLTTWTVYVPAGTAGESGLSDGRRPGERPGQAWLRPAQQRPQRHRRWTSGTVKRVHTLTTRSKAKAAREQSKAETTRKKKIQRAGPTAQSHTHSPLRRNASTSLSAGSPRGRRRKPKPLTHPARLPAVPQTHTAAASPRPSAAPPPPQCAAVDQQRPREAPFPAAAAPPPGHPDRPPAPRGPAQSLKPPATPPPSSHPAGASCPTRSAWPRRRQ